MRIVKNTLPFLYFLSPLLVIAQGGAPPPTSFTGPGNIPSDITTPEDFIGVMQNILGWAFAFAMIIGVAMLIIAGVMYITSMGSDRTKTAVSIMIYAIVGIAVTGFAWAIVNVVQTIFFETPTDVT